MLGASQSITSPNIILNTIMAEELSLFADALEKAEDFEDALQNLVCSALADHSRIIYNGNGYSDEWKAEAQRRGLSNYSSTAQCLPTYISQRNLDLVTRHGIFTESEFHARYEIYLESYSKIVNIEARTSVDMALHQILPAAIAYTNSLCSAVINKQSLNAGCYAEKELINRLSDATNQVYKICQRMNQHLSNLPTGSEAIANYYHEVIIADMQQLRVQADILEQLTDKKYWPYPTYSDLLFY